MGRHRQQGAGGSEGGAGSEAPSSNVGQTLNAQRPMAEDESSATNFDLLTSSCFLLALSF
jgi:hypothetical protein